MSNVIKLSDTGHSERTRVVELGLAKLESSGFDAEDADQLGMTFLTRQETHALWAGFKPLASLKIPYFDMDGKPLPMNLVNRSPFYRLRYLEDASSVFGEKPDKKDKQKYMQERGSDQLIYLPRINTDWRAIADDPNEPLIITEGELKAAKACREGFPTIGLGGVSCWRSGPKGIEINPMLEDFFWHSRNVYICFDSDLSTNKDVAKALVSIADELARRGAIPHLASLPPLENLKKVGLDDFLTFHPDGNAELKKILKAAPPLGLAKPLLELNKKYVLVRNPGFIIDQHTLSKYEPGVFKNLIESTARYRVTEVKPGAVEATHSKVVPAAAEWIQWPMRNEAEALIYEPGKKLYVDDCFNTWRGWGTAPKKGDINLFTELFDFIFDGADPASKKWFLQWLAYPLQHPGVKMYSAAVIHGIMTGTGKSLIGYTMQRIYGDSNSSVITGNDLLSPFNEWSVDKQFIVVEEMSTTDKRVESDLLKNLITQKNVRVNQKYIAAYTLRDCINYYFSANHPDAFYLEDLDRRFFIHEVTAKKPLAQKFYDTYDEWYKGEEGPAAIFDHLLSVDLTGFNPRAPARSTIDKERMIDLGHSDAASWVGELLENPDSVLRVGRVPVARDLWSSRELLDFFYVGRDTKGNLTANGLSRLLSKRGVRTVCDNKPIKLKDGSQARYLAVRNREKWATSTYGEITKHLNEQASGPALEQK